MSKTVNLFVPSHHMQSGDEGIYWQVNFERFHLHFRDQAIISAVVSKLDQVTTGFLQQPFSDVL